jgi:hypothetical protein
MESTPYAIKPWGSAGLPRSYGQDLAAKGVPGDRAGAVFIEILCTKLQYQIMSTGRTAGLPGYSGDYPNVGDVACSASNSQTRFQFSQKTQVTTPLSHSRDYPSRSHAMRTLPIRLTLAIILALASLTAVVPQALAHHEEDHARCSTELLEGTFSYATQSLAATSSIAIFLPIGSYSPFAWAGNISFDGNGNLSGADVANLGDGGINRTYTGTYNVVDPTASRRNCAFTSTFTATYQSAVPPTTPTTFHMYMVLARDGMVLELVETDPGFVQAFKAERK